MRKKRVYVIEFDIHLNVYSDNAADIWENRRESYFENDRDKFIERFIEITGKHYIENVKCHVAILEEINMDEVVNAI